MKCGWYFYYSTLLLHISTIIYFLLLLITDYSWLIITVFSSVYTLETIVKYFTQPIYMCTYFHKGFKLVDIVSGPLSLLLCILLPVKKVESQKWMIVMVGIKILTCKAYIQHIKQFWYLAKCSYHSIVTFIYIWCAFVCISFLSLEQFSKNFSSLINTLIVLLKIITFDDDWNYSNLTQIRKTTSDWIVLYFIFFILITQLSYMVTMLSFFVVYYSSPDIKMDFSFSSVEGITVQNLSKQLNLKLGKNICLQNYSQLHVLLLFIMIVIEDIEHQPNQLYRMITIAIMIIFNLALLVINCGQIFHKNKFAFLAWLRSCGGIFLFLVLLIVQKYSVAVLIFYLVTCIFDFIDHNIFMNYFVKEYTRLIVGYIILIGSYLYIMAVLLVDTEIEIVSYLDQETDNLLNSFLLNLSILNFDRIGDFARPLFYSKPYWIFYFFIAIFVGGFVILEVLTGQLLDLISQPVKQHLKVCKSLATRIYFNDLTRLAKLSQKRLQQQLKIGQL